MVRQSKISSFNELTLHLWEIQLKNKSFDFIAKIKICAGETIDALYK